MDPKLGPEGNGKRDDGKQDGTKRMELTHHSVGTAVPRISEAEAKMLGQLHQQALELYKKIKRMEGRVQGRPHWFGLNFWLPFQPAEPQKTPLPLPLLGWTFRETYVQRERRLQERITTISRPYVNATIYDLPDELLLKIITDDVDSTGRPALSCIKLCRLVSPRFCRIASEFLLSEVRIDPECQESLARLEAISNHEQIRFSIKSIRVVFRWYDNYDEDYVDAAIFLHGFAQSVAAALSRMPHARTLYLVESDQDGPTSLEYSLAWATPLAVPRGLAVLFDPDYTNAKTIAVIMDALSQAKVFPHTITIQTHHQIGWFSPISPCQYKQICAATKDLETFHFTALHHSPPYDASSPRRSTPAEGRRGYEKLCSPFLNAPRLHTLSIDLERTLNHNLEPGAERSWENIKGPILWGASLAAKPHPGLVDITLRGLKVHEKHLTAFLGSPRRMRALRLDPITLWSGLRTWASMLDTLRQFECPTILGVMYREGFIFGPYDVRRTAIERGADGVSQVERYIRGEIEQNPLQITIAGMAVLPEQQQLEAEALELLRLFEERGSCGYL